MAALLYSGEYVHARHLWRRRRSIPPASGAAATDAQQQEAVLLADWWTVGKALLEYDGTTLWATLQKIESSHPAPLPHYAKEVGTAIRQRLWRDHPLAQPYLQLWNVTSAKEALALCQTMDMTTIPSASGSSKKSSSTSVDTVVAFLERQTAAAALVTPAASSTTTTTSA
jgi:hypothetical protein